MLRTINKLGILLGFVCFLSCKKQTNIVVKNTLDVPRSSENVVLTKAFLKVESLKNIGIKNKSTGQPEVVQLVDLDGDGEMDELLFQPKVESNSETNFAVVTVTEQEQPKSETWCYSRFVPERTDDYTWENDKVAFRMYGPTAQKMKEGGVPGGTLSSGIDGWLKKVSYPIINKWYAENDEHPGAYHKDTGEGLDNFHVGVSRGIGGLAIKENNTYHFSKNYTAWKTITTGPLRTSFYLKFADWKVGNQTITEHKIITLDKGNNLSKIETFITGTDKVAVGLTLHDQKGKVDVNQKQGWMSYWEPLQDSEIGTGIVASNNDFLGQETYIVEEKDLCNAYAHLKVNNNKVTYYAGFGWKKAKEFTTEAEWKAYLKDFKNKLEYPLLVELK